MLNQTRKITSLKPNPHQSEIYGDVSDAELQALAEDIDLHGLRHPIEITPGDVIIDGHQRVRAYQWLNWDEIDVVVCDPLAPDELKERFIKANLNRRQLDPVAMARAIKSLAEIECARKGTRLNTSKNIEFREYLASKLGGNLSGRTVDRYLRLLTLPREIQDAVSSGKLPMTAALKVAALTKSKRNAIATRIAKGEDPKRVVNEQFPKTKNTNPSADETPADETPADAYLQMMRHLDNWIDDFDGHEDDLVGKMPPQQTVNLLARLMRFCERLSFLENAAREKSLESLRAEFPNVSF